MPSLLTVEDIERLSVDAPPGSDKARITLDLKP